MSDPAPLSLAVQAIAPGQVPAQTRQSDRARHLLACFHERHVPLTPRLAEALAGLEAARRPSAAQVWGAAFTPMGQVLGMPGRFGHSPAVIKDAALFHTRVAEPLLRRAASMVGRVVLLGPATWTADGTAPDYDGYCRRIEALMTRLLHEPEEMGEGFWAAAGLALMASARSLPGRLCDAMPEPMRARLLFSLDPAFPPEGRNTFRDRRPKSRSDRDRSGTRPKEGGVKGVTQTTRVEDFGDAALSEYMQPREILMNKLLHEGYLMRHRPPKRTPRRDLLVMAVHHDGGARPDIGALFAGAFADAALRGQILLTAMNMMQSDLVFAGIAGGQARLAHHDIETAPPLPTINPLSLSGDPRRLALTRSGLAGPLADRRLAALPRPTEGDATAPQDLRAALEHLRHASPARADLDPDLYASRLVIECLTQDAPEGERDFLSARSVLSHELGYGQADAIRLARITLPARIAAGETLVWQHGKTGTERQEVTVPEEDETALNQVFGALSLWMLQSMREVLDDAA